MICIDELRSTFNRIILLQNNTESVDEEIMASVIVQNLGTMIKQLEMMSGSPEFKMEVEQERERRKHDTEQSTENQI